MVPPREDWCGWFHRPTLGRAVRQLTSESSSDSALNEPADLLSHFHSSPIYQLLHSRFFLLTLSLAQMCCAYVFPSAVLLDGLPVTVSSCREPDFDWRSCSPSLLYGPTSTTFPRNGSEDHSSAEVKSREVSTGSLLKPDKIYYQQPLQAAAHSDQTEKNRIPSL